MTVVFIPTTDYASNAADASTIDVLRYDRPFSHFNPGDTKAFKVGNRSVRLIKLTLGTWDLTGMEWALNTSTVTLQPGQISDTITVRPVRLGQDPWEWQRCDVEATDADTGEITILPITYTVVGFNETPDTDLDRVGDFTQTVTGVIDRFGEPIRLCRWEPIAYDPADKSAYMVDGQIITPGDVCARLDPNNPTWGYIQTHAEPVVAQFSAEDFTIRQSFTASNTEVTFQGGAHLLIPGWYMMPHNYALFALARGADRDQYKRTVWAFERRGQWWAIHWCKAVYRGGEIAYHSADLVPLEWASPGKPTYYNPFAFTWLDGSDIPYAQFSCRLTAPTRVDVDDPYIDPATAIVFT